jgi:C-terminal processing protease CtpA/Prc
VFAEAGIRVAFHLKRLSSEGAFDKTPDAESLAAALTASIQEVEADPHIEVLQPPPVREAAARPEARANQPEWLEPLRRRNYDFVRAERLPGNVGVLQLNSFPPPEVAEPTAAAAMQFLQNVDALIVDLRENSGGTGDMVRLLASHFFVERTALIQTFRRASEPQITVDYTLTELTGRRVPAIDIFVLTSKRTFSAAEAFTFALQDRGRAVVVGETTRGGANAGRYRDLPYGFRVFIPDSHASSPVSQKSWDRIGIKPDIASPATSAFDVAYREALRRLIVSARSEEERLRLIEALQKLGK